MPPHPYIAEQMARLAAAPPLHAGTPEAARAAFAAARPHLGPEAPLADRADIALPTRSGSRPARWLIPEGAGDTTLLYLHGGGWVIGGLDDFETMGRRLAQLSASRILMLDYRLAPEHPFPAGLEDAVDALDFLLEEAPGPLLVGGDSAGANLATVAARRFPGRLAGQLLFYPLVGSDFETESYRDFGAGWPLTEADMRWFFGHYAPPDLWPDPDITPLHAADLSDLPLAFIAVAEYDVLASEAWAYARELSDAGVPVTLREARGMAHGYLRQHNFVEEADETLKHAARMIREMAAA